MSYARAIVVPWLCYAAVMACLSLAESRLQGAVRLHRIGGRWLNFPDLAFNLVALLGLVAAVVWSVRGAYADSPAVRRMTTIAAILAGSFVGPLLATAAVFGLADDVDGILWMSISPIVGLVVASVALVIGAIMTRRS